MGAGRVGGFIDFAFKLFYRFYHHNNGFYFGFSRRLAYKVFIGNAGGSFGDVPLICSDGKSFSRSAT